jgi:PAS domain S-box-containing protein
MSERWAPPVELFPEFVVTIARDRTILYLNRTLTVPVQSLIGRSIDEFVPPHAHDEIHGLIEEVFTSGERRYLDIRMTSPVSMVLQTTYLPMVEGGEVVAVVAVSRDVTAQRQAEELLSDRQGLLQALLHAFPDMVFRVRSDGVILDFSGDPKSTLLPPEHFLQKRVDETLPEDVASALMDAVRRVVREEGIISVEYDVLVKGEIRYYEARMVRSGADEALSIVRDRTQQRKMEQRLLQADRISSLGALAAGVAHEINNPLTYVVGNLTLAARELAALEVPEEVAFKLHDLQKALADARAGADRVRFIVSDLNTFGSEPRAELTNVDLRKVLDSAINMAWSEIRHRARLVREYRDGPAVLGNEHRLGQVFLNLLVNAAQAIEEGDAQKNTIQVVTGLEDGVIVVSIQDSGRGFDDNVGARMFDPFFTTKPLGEGTGLGLAICRSIIDSLGGQIVASSEGVGRGSVFTVRLPAAEGPAAARPPQKHEAAEGDPIRGRVLVVDDEPVIATLAQRALANHEVYVVTSGRDALDLCRDQEFDVILCDLLMPDVTGMDLYDRLKADGEGVEQRIVFMTAGAFTPRARRFLAQVSNPHLEKPFDVDDLELAVQRALRAHSRI